MDNSTTAAMFADDTAILATDDTEVAATAKLQQAVNAVHKWSIQWKIKFNSSNSASHLFPPQQSTTPGHSKRGIDTAARLSEILGYTS